MEDQRIPKIFLNLLPLLTPNIKILQ